MADVEKVKFALGYVTPFDVTATLIAPAVCGEVTHSMMVADSEDTSHVSPSKVTMDVALNP